MTVIRGTAARRLMARTRVPHVEHARSGPVLAWTAGPVVVADRRGSQVRFFVRDQLDLHTMSDRYDDTMLVVSELVTNAFVHGRPPVLLSLSHLGHGRLSVEVTDAALPSRALEAASEAHRATWPVLRGGAREQADSGRGLEIVGLLVSSWGVHGHASGKCVRALLEQDAT